MGTILMVIGSFVVLLSLGLLFMSIQIDNISPLVCLVGALVGVFIGTIGCSLTAVSGRNSQIQIQTPEGETAIIKIYDINENLINEWRVEK